MIIPPSPAIILVRPQLGENIGAVARAMANFGFSELRLVAPKEKWPNEKARRMASGAEQIIDSATLFDDFNSAMADIQTAYATTARPRDMQKRVVTPEEAMEEIIPPPLRGSVTREARRVGGSATSHNTTTSPPPSLPPQGGEELRTALVFGPERTGLENDEIILCDTLITIPTAPEKASLNLAQSMVILGYEWWKQSSVARVQSSEKEPATELRTLNSDHSAPKAHWTGLFDQLDSYLEDIGYYRVADKKPVMWQNMRNQLMRGRWNEQEIRTFRGMLRILYEGRKPRSKR